MCGGDRSSCNGVEDIPRPAQKAFPPGLQSRFAIAGGESNFRIDIFTNINIKRMTQKGEFGGLPPELVLLTRNILEK
jgi:hypothetical protein